MYHSIVEPRAQLHNCYGINVYKIKIKFCAEESNTKKFDKKCSDEEGLFDLKNMMVHILMQRGLPLTFTFSFIDPFSVEL